MRPQSSFLRDSSSVFLRAYLDRDEGISRVVSSYLLDRFFSPRFRRLSRFLRTFSPSLSSRLSRVSGYVDSRLFNDGESILVVVVVFSASSYVSIESFFAGKRYQ